MQVTEKKSVQSSQTQTVQQETASKTTETPTAQPQGIYQIADNFQRTVAAPGDFFKGLVDSGANQAQSLLNSVKNMYDTASNALKPFLDNLQKMINPEAGQPQQEVNQVTNPFTDPINRFINAIRSFFQDQIIYGDGKTGKAGGDYDLNPQNAKAARDEVLNGTKTSLDLTNRDAVASVERQLIELGYAVDNYGSGSDTSYGATADGKSGDGLTRAITQFQKDHGLPETGAIDAQTLRGLDTAWQEKANTMTLPQLAVESQRMNGMLSASDYLKNNHDLITEVANNHNIDPKTMYGILYAESGGGINNRPRFEKGHYDKLITERDAVKGYQQELTQLQGNLQSANPTERQAAVDRTNAIWRELTNGLGLGPGVLRSMAPNNATPEQKLAAMQQMASFSDGRIRELSTSWGFGQIMGWHTLNQNWQTKSGMTSEQLLQNIQSRDDRTQLETMVSFMDYNGELQYAQNGDIDSLARVHNTGSVNGEPVPGYIDNANAGIDLWNEYEAELAQQQR